ncbi:SPASM domain-containing protein [Flavobacterium zhairuonense]|uniref:radical SAM/SPASM domain-containing protein n=1 Tax=Flavobacterium zhairuonense TaxID=2493631 RepID=UPI00104DAE46|nr:radical SAM protein [Flavobacterium zhairuonense]KAF2506894.1 SPASM domain-containing protein [Flavobacterium zhairuonense]
MKYSQFNSIVPHEGKYALYNSFQNKVIFLDPELKDLLQAGISEGIDGLEEVHPSFFEYLTDNKFIVKNELNEIDEIKKISKAVDENQKNYILTINPTMNCNFKCYYCYETHIRKSRLEDKEIEKIKKFIDTTASREKLESFTLSFFGGEPLLYFERNVIPVIDHFTARCKENKKTFNIGFTTNGYLINQNFVDYFKNNNIECALQITLDGYREEHDKVRYVSKTKGSYFEIINNVKLLVNNNFYVVLRINYTDENLPNTNKIPQDFSDISQEIKDKYLRFDFHRVWENNKVDDLHLVLEKNISEIRDEGFVANGTYSPDNVNDSCYADKRNSVVINYNGDIFKCTARDFETKNRAGFISDNGDLIWENDYLEKRMNAKFNNKPCLSCKIMPLCNGGCTQHAMEHIESGTDYCVYHGLESEKDIIVKTKIQDILNEVLQEA